VALCTWARCGQASTRRDRRSVDGPAGVVTARSIPCRWPCQIARRLPLAAQRRSARRVSRPGPAAPRVWPARRRRIRRQRRAAEPAASPGNPRTRPARPLVIERFSPLRQPLQLPAIRSHRQPSDRSLIAVDRHRSVRRLVGLHPDQHHRECLLLHALGQQGEQEPAQGRGVGGTATQFDKTTVGTYVRKVPDLVSTRVQLWRVDALDRVDAWAYRWRTTVTRVPSQRRSWSEGVLLAHPERGVTRVGPHSEGFETAVSVLADLKHRIGRLPVAVDLRFDDHPTIESDTARRSWGRRPRYDRPDRRGETLGERAARLRQQDNPD
jgi:hypothetical protein